MKNITKLGMCSVLLFSGLVGGMLGITNTTAQASSNDLNEKVTQQVVGLFKDLKKSHYAYEAVNWAKNKGIVGGFPDGTFKPNKEVTEAEFVKMLTQYLNLVDDKGDLNKYTNVKHWADGNYDAAATYGIPLNGYFDNALRNKPVKRGVTAQAIGHLTGNVNSLTDSINFLIIEGITTGKNPQFAGKDFFKHFGSQNNLTRAEVAAFLYRMNNVDIDKAVGLSVAVKDNQESLTLVGQANKGMNKLDKSLRLGKFGSETSTTSKLNITFTPGQVGRDIDEVKEERKKYLENGSMNDGSGSALVFVPFEEEITAKNKKLVENLDESLGFKTSDEQTYIFDKSNTSNSIFIYTPHPPTFGNKKELTYYDQSIWLSEGFYKKNKEESLKMINNAGFNLTAKELEDGIAKAKKNNDFYNIPKIRNYKFIEMGAYDFIAIERLD